MPRRSRGYWNQDQDITGSDRSEFIFTGRGDDTINAGGGNDIVFSGSGDDVVDGGAGRDYVNAGAGNDTLIFTMEDLSDACWGGHGRGHGHGGRGHRGHHHGPRYDIYDGGRGFDTLVINLTAEQFANPDLVVELSAYLDAIDAGGRSCGYTFLSELGLAVRSIEAVQIMVDGVLTDPRDPDPVDDVIAVDDSFAVDEDGQVTGSVAGNDTAPSGAVFTLLTLPSAGVLTFDADGGISFDAAGAFDSLAEGASTEVTFTYEISAGGVTGTASATITINGTNDAPVVAAALSASAAEDDASFTVDLLDGASDVDDLATLSVTNVSTLPAGVTLTGTTLTVDPADASFQHLNVGDTEVITVSYDVTDEHGATAAQTATITLTGTNDAPTATATMTNGTYEGYPGLVINLLTGANDVDDNATLSVINVDPLPDGLTLVGNTLVLDPTDPSFEHLNVGDFAEFNISFEITDEHGATTPRTSTVKVTGTNDAPTVSAITDTTDEDSAFAVDLLDHASDVDDGAVLTFSNATQTSGRSAGIVLMGNFLNVDPTAFQDLDEGDSEELTVTYLVTDENGASVTNTVTLTVTGTNDTPVVSYPLAAMADEDFSAFTLDLLNGASDVDASAVLSVTNVSALPAGVTLTGTTLTVDPADASFQHLNVGDTEVITVTYDVTDEHGATAAQTATITLTGTNDAPVVAAGLSAAADEDDASFTVDLLDGASDVDDLATLSVTNVSALPAGVTLTGTTLTVDPADASFQHLNVGDTEVITVSYDVTDEHGATAAQIATITITGTNDAPVVSSAPSFTTNEDEASITVDLLQNASDVDDGATLSVANVVQTGGVLAPFTLSGDEITADPSNFQYLALGESVSMTFAYDVVDEHGASAATTADIVIEGRNDDPFVISTIPLQLTETGVPYSLATGAAVFDDVDTTDTHTYSAALVGGGSLPAWLTIDPATGTLSGTPTEDIGLYHIELTMTDPHGASATTTFWLIENGNYVTGTSAPDELAGTNAANVLIGEVSNDGLYGGENSDIYVVRKGDGMDVVAEVGYLDTDIIFVDGVDAADAVFTRVDPTSDDFIISAGGQDIVLVRDSLNESAYSEIEQIVFSDGTVMDMQDVREALFASEQTADGEFIWGSTRPDTIGGTAGDDFLQGNDGSDGYLFGMGDGQDVILDRGFGDTDVLRFTDYSSTDAVFSRLPGDESSLVIDLPNGDQVTIMNTLNQNSNDQVEQIRFDGDNVTLSMGDVREILLSDATNSGEGYIRAFNGTDTLFSGAGDDFMSGAQGSDTYVFGMGDGIDIVSDDGFSSTDVVRFTDYSFSDATFSRDMDSPNDLIISFANGDQVTVRNTLTSNSADQIEQFEFLGSGLPEYYSMEDVRQIIMDDANLNPVNGEVVGIGQRADTLINSLGVSAMAGGTGGDTYVMGTFFHNVVIKDKGYGAGDVLDLSDYTMADATFREREEDSNSFVLTLAGGGEILLLDQHTSADRIETYTFADGSMTYSDADAAAALAAPVGDVFMGTSSGDTLAANGGHDHLFGLGGSDTYNFTSGNGIVEIEDNGAGSSDLLYFTDYNYADANFAVVEGARSDLLIWFAGGDQVLVRNALLASHGDDIENYLFADGTVISANDMRQMMTDAYATGGDDVIYGFAGTQTLNGGAGDDVMIGSAGSDNYVYNAGDGADVIRDNGNGGSDTLTINGYDLADATVTFLRDSGDIKLVFGGGDQLIIRGSLENSFSNTIETVTFSGTGVQAMTMADFRAIAIAQQVSTGDDNISGTSQADVIAAGLGDDGIVGGGGNDSYVYTLGDGHDVIQDNGNGGNDTLIINGVLSTEVSFDRGAENGANLTVTFSDGGTVRILNTLHDSFADGLETITFAADGVTMTMKDVRDALIADQTTAGDDEIFGFNVGTGEVLEGGAGDDYLSGGDGSDTYIFNIGDGDDVVSENGAYDTDVFVFAGRDIADATFSVLAPGDGDLMIDFANGDSVWVIGGENGNYQDRIESFQFDDGTLSYTDVLGLL